MLENAVMALIETIGAHPEFNGPLGEALKRHNVNLDAPAYHVCRDIGTSYTTATFLMREGDSWEARAGIAIMGHTNMKWEDLDKVSPFDDDFHDNYVSGVGASPKEAIDNMHKDRTKLCDSLWNE